MKQVYFLYDFNPYHNRQIKRFATLSEYLAAAGNYFTQQHTQNFSYNDGVDTSIQMRIEGTTTVTNSMNPDYALIYDSTNLVIESRWFILDATKELDKSYTFTLHRDTVADSYDDVITAPAYIQKATLNPSDPFIFNQENITVNRIKKSETLLKDKSNCAWVVGYCAPDIADKTITITPQRDADYVYNTSTAFQSDFAQYAYCKFANNGGDANLPTSEPTKNYIDTGCAIQFNWQNTFTYDNKPYRCLQFMWSLQQPIESYQFSFATLNDLKNSAQTQSDYAPYKKATILPNTVKDSVAAAFEANKSTIESYIGQSTDLLSIYNNKTWKIGSKYYTSKVIRTGAALTWSRSVGTTGNGAITTVLRGLNWESIDTVANDAVFFNSIQDQQYLYFTEITAGNATVNLSFTAIPNLNNLPYKMFAIPVSNEANISIVDGNNTAICSMESDLGYLVANALSAQYSGSNSIYDIQLLPYCPVPGYIKNANIMIQPATTDKYTPIYATGTSNTVGIIYWCTENTFTFSINHTINVTNVKLDAIADMHRLCSPNWNGQFEFNASKNGGVSKFDVDCTYKPYTPYIHINPDFGRLYGEDFNDARGLICSGDFSLPQTNDTWKTYEINNKNYQNQFDRQIQNLELTQGIAMKKQKFAAGVGAISGAMSGLATGATLSGGNPFGAVAGMAVGGALSAYGAYKDIGYQKQLNKEVIDYTTDQFEMNNDNIQAMPDSLKQVGAFTANNKIFPVLEYYSCTDEEKEAIIQKLFYNGMTVERIGKIEDYIQTTESYIKCKLIRINIPEDNHYIESLAEELYKGVFIK